MRDESKQHFSAAHNLLSDTQSWIDQYTFPRTSSIPCSRECFLSFSLCFIYLTTIFLSYHYCFKRDSYHLQRGFQLLSPISSPSHSVLPVLPHFEPFPLVLYIFTTPPTLSHSSPLVFGLFLLYFNAYYLFFYLFHTHFNLPFTLVSNLFLFALQHILTHFRPLPTKLEP